jgi:hypothetical protein
MKHGRLREVTVPAIHRAGIAKRARCGYEKRLIARTEEDVDDFSHFAVRVLASEAHAGRLPVLLRPISVSIDRA